MTNRQYLERMVYRTRHMKSRLSRKLDRMTRLLPRDKTRVLALFGIAGHCKHIPLSDLTAREHALRALYRSTGEFFKNTPPEISVYHGTFADDCGFTTDREAHFRLRAVQGKVDRAIRKLGLNGLVVFEVQAINNYPGRGAGYGLMLHAHSLLWGAIDHDDLMPMIDQINASRAWSNLFGAPPIKLRLLDATKCEAQFIASYLLKPPFNVKRRIRTPWGYRFASVQSGYRDHLLLRIMEGLSAYPIYSFVSGVRDGKIIRKQWKSEMEMWRRARDAEEPPLQPFNFPVPWRRVRQTYPNRGNYKPFIIE